MTTVLVPLRDPADAKRRLRPVLRSAERQRLTTAMFAEVIACLRRSGGISDVVVLAGSPAARCLATRSGLRALDDPCGARRGLSAAVDAAQHLPWPGAIAVSKDGGTSGLRLAPGVRLRTAFGVGSGERHIRTARLGGHSVVELRSPGFMEDIDRPADLHGTRAPAATAALHGSPEGDGVLGVLPEESPAWM